MKYFFTAAIASADSAGEAHSAEAVRQRIRKMIEEEDPEDVLSDDGIVERLRKADIVVARRTVAKYRDSLKIPSSVERRKLKMSPIRLSEAYESSARCGSLKSIRINRTEPCPRD
jgi:RNA polymerase sigma-54 factor